MYSVDMKTLRQIRKTERKNRVFISADVLHSDKIMDFTIIHSRTEIITDFDPRTGEEGAEKAIMDKYNSWVGGG